jgi:hypothetical protein
VPTLIVRFVYRPLESLGLGEGVNTVPALFWTLYALPATIGSAAAWPANAIKPTHTLVANTRFTCFIRFLDPVNLAPARGRTPTTLHAICMPLMSFNDLQGFCSRSVKQAVSHGTKAVPGGCGALRVEKTPGYFVDGRKMANFRYQQLRKLVQ